MNRQQLLETIRRAPSLRHFVNENLFERTPWLFETTGCDYGAWRGQVAAPLGLPSGEVFLVGSAATGYSLSPYKPGRPFRRTGRGGAAPSDLDIAIVAPNAFVEAWDTLITHDSMGQLVGNGKFRVQVYWGVVSDSNVLSGAAVSAALRTALAAASRTRPGRGHEVRARLYRRRDDLILYHVHSLRSLCTELEEPGR